MFKLVIYKPISTAELRQWFSSARVQHGLSFQYRDDNQTSIMPNMLPGDNPSGKRFNQNKTIIENLVEIASVITRFYSLELGIKAVDLSLGLLLKICPSIKSIDREELTDICVYALLNPHVEFRYAPLTPDEKNNKAFKALKRNHFSAYYSKKPPQYDIYNLSAEHTEALALFSRVFAKPGDIRPLMEQFFLNAPAMAVANRWSAIQIAAYVHNQIIKIHPFVDGNGRTARFMANQILLKHGLNSIPDFKTNRYSEGSYDRIVASYDDKALADWIASYQTPRTFIEKSPALDLCYPAYLYFVRNTPSKPLHHSMKTPSSDLQDVVESDTLDIPCVASRSIPRGLFFQPGPLSYDLPDDFLIEDASVFIPKPYP